MNVNFSLPASDFALRLQILSKTISGKNGMSILDCFLLEINGNSLKITASDIDNTMIAHMDITSSDNDIRFAINAKNLLDAIRPLPDQPLNFEVDTDTYQTNISYLRGHISLVGQSPDEYPTSSLSEEETEDSFEMSSTLLYESLSRALSSVATDANHIEMTGVLFDVTESDISIVSSDGRKLVYTRFPNENKSKAGSFILPAKAAALLKLVMGKDEVSATLNFSQSRCAIGANGYELTSRLLEGRFPPYNKVVPQNNPYHLVLNRDAFLSLLSRVTCVASDMSSSTVKLHIESDKIVTSVQNIDYSLSAEESMNAEYDGMPMDIGFKGDVLLEFLKNTDSENIELQIADQSRAVVMIPSPQPNTVKDENGECKDKEEIVMLLMPNYAND